MSGKNKIIAIDGTTASGKGTLAKRLADHFDLPYLNTGLLYRSVAYYFYKNNLDYSDNSFVIENLSKISFDDLDNPELSLESVGSIASKVAVIPEVRKFLFNFQVDFSKNEKGAVLDGRDIGTVICPQASYKFFVIADAKIRAERRYKEMIEKGFSADYDVILKKIVERDKNDFERKESPLKKAEDAIEIDTSNLTREGVFLEALKYIDIQK